MSASLSNEFVKKQKESLLKMKRDILNRLQTQGNEELQTPSEELIEEGDISQNYINQNIAFGLKERDLNRLREIDYALEKIENGSYGICEEMDEPISKKRLEKMPWARLCLQAAEEQERNQKTYRVV
jgi:DnaK suppressor protein